MPQNYVQLTYPYPYKTIDGSISGSGSGTASYVNGIFSGNVTVAGTTTGSIITATAVMNSPYFVGNATGNSSIFSSQTNVLAGTGAQSGWQSVNDLNDVLTMLVNSSTYSGIYAARTAVLESGATATGMILNAKGTLPANNTVNIQSNNVSGFTISNTAGAITTTMPQFTTSGGLLTSNGSGVITSSTAVVVNSISTNSIAINVNTTTFTVNSQVLTLTNTSLGNQLLKESGAGNYTGCLLKLPNATTLSVGTTYIVNNNCTTNITIAVQTSAGAGIVSSFPGSYLTFICVAIGSDVVASWDWHSQTSAGTTWGTTLATSSIINASGGFNGTVGAATPSTGVFTTITGNTGYNGPIGSTPNTGAFTTLNSTSSTASFNTPGCYITNTNSNPQCSFSVNAPNMANANAIYVSLGKALSNNNAAAITYTQQASVGSNSLSFGFYGAIGANFTMYNSIVASTLNTPLTVTGLVNATTLQLTSNMATAGVLLNDASGNVTSSLGALAVGKGGTGVTAGYGTGTTVALPPTGGLAGNALVSGAGAGAALTWSAGQGAVYCYRQATGTTCPNTTLTGITWDTLITTTGQPLATNFTYAANSGGTGGTFTYVGTNTVAIYISFTVNMASTNCTLTANINPSSGSQITSAGSGGGTYNYTSNVSGVIVLATNGTFNCQANQTSGASRVTTIGIGANATCLSIVVLPI